MFSKVTIVWFKSFKSTGLDFVDLQKKIVPGGQAAETVLRERFKELECQIDFSDLKYVGTRTSRDQTTDFTKLQKVVQDMLSNKSIRAPRKPEIIFKIFQVKKDSIYSVIT